MCECKLFYLSAFVLCNVFFVTCFNIDDINYAVYGSDNAAMFGFTVAVHKDGGNRPWVLVGAPEAQSRYHYSNEVIKGGAVYKCRPDADNACVEVIFDRQPSNKKFRSTPIDDKSHQWFGATLSSSGRKDGPIVACAPRYVWFTRDLNRRDPVGTCFVSNGALDSFEEYSPCRTMNWGYHRQGSCQAGFSAAINRDGDRLFVGAPGSYYWQGQMYSIDAHATFNYTPSFFGNLGYGAKGSVHQQSLENRPAVFSTREGSPPDDDSYMGYSTVAGHFKENEQYEGIAVGMPRGNSLRGKVLLFTWSLKNYKNITISKQIGSYFGYSITAADINGDKKLDLIVGAPMHTEPNNEMKYDVGRIYVFYQTSDEFESFNTFHFIDGINSKSRFGHAVSTLGDLNQDGCDDFAVGAPYDGPNGRGAVYIYYGSRKGIRKKYGQVIYAEALQSNVPLKTFGFSLTGGIDLDDNDYPDMAVGAYLADAAFFFRSRPVVLVEASVRYQTSQNQIDIKRKNCTLHNGQRGTCTAIKFCMKYTGKGIPGKIPFIVEYILDSKKLNSPRMGFMRRGTHTFNNTIQLQAETEACETYEIYVKNDIRDKLTPLEAKVNYYLVEYSSPDRRRNPQALLRPVLDLNSPPSRKDTLIIQKDCGDDNICIPDLHLNVTSKVQKHLLGSGEDLVLNVVVSNFGEDSFETTFKMNYSKGIHLRKVETDPHLPGILCSPNVNNNTMTCDIGNPLPKGGIAKFSILFQPPAQEEGVALTYDFDVDVNSTNPENETTRADNHKHISIDISVDASIELRGDSYPSTVYYNESLYTAKEIVRESDIGPQVTHVYYITNRGPSLIREAEVFVLWPHKSLGDEDLLYLLEQPHTQGNVKCDAFQQYIDASQLIQLPYNYKHYELDYHVASIWDRLKIDTSNVVKNVTMESAKPEIIERGKGVLSGVGVENINAGVSNTSSGDSSSVFATRHGSSVNSQGTIQTSGITTTMTSRYYTEWVDGVNKTTWENITTVRDANGNILAQSLTILDNGIPKTTWQNFTTIKDNNGKVLARSRTTINNGIPTTTWDNATFFQDYFFENRRPVVVGDVHGTRGSFTRTSSTTNQSRGQQGSFQTPYQERRPINERPEPGINEEESRGYQVTTTHTGGQRINGQQIPKQFGGQESTYREEHVYEVGGGPREGGIQGQYEQGQFQGQYEQGQVQKQGQFQGQYEQGQGQRQHGQSRTQGQYGQGQFSSQERTYGSQTFNQGGHQQNAGEGGQQVYYGRGVYRGPTGHVVYNRTYTVEGSTAIPIDLAGSQSSQQQLNEIALGRGFRVQFLDSDAASESSIAGGVAGGSQSETVYGQGEHNRNTHGQGQGTYGQKSGSTYYESGRTYNQGESTYDQSGDVRYQNGDIYGQGGSISRSAGGFGQVYDREGGSTRTSGHGSSSQGEYSTNWHTEGSFSQSGKIPPTIIHNDIGRDNVPTDRPTSNQRHRGKRMAGDFFDDILASQNCISTKCSYIRCVVGTLDRDKEVAIALRSRLNVRAVRNLTSSQSVKLSSMVIGRISKLPYIGVPKQEVPRKHEIFTEVPAKEMELVPEVAPLWIYVVSAVAGVVMLLLLIWILSKCGFFKRNRPSSAPERQPLNRNGYQSGDEAL